MIGTIILGEVGWVQILLILAVIVLLFGGKKIPELMRGIGDGVREFKKASKDQEEKGKTTESEKK